MKTIQAVWSNICKHSGEVFYTKTGIPFTYQSEVHRIVVPSKHCSISKRMFETALTVHPLTVLNINNAKITGSSYVYSLLTDPRIIAE